MNIPHICVTNHLQHCVQNPIFLFHLIFRSNVPSSASIFLYVSTMYFFRPLPDLASNTRLGLVVQEMSFLSTHLFVPHIDLDFYLFLYYNLDRFLRRDSWLISHALFSLFWIVYLYCSCFKFICFICLQMIFFKIIKFTLIDWLRHNQL